MCAHHANDAFYLSLSPRRRHSHVPTNIYSDPVVCVCICISKAQYIFVRVWVFLYIPPLYICRSVDSLRNTNIYMLWVCFTMGTQYTHAHRHTRTHVYSSRWAAASPTSHTHMRSTCVYVAQVEVRVLKEMRAQRSVYEHTYVLYVLCIYVNVCMDAYVCVWYSILVYAVCVYTILIYSECIASDI